MAKPLHQRSNYGCWTCKARKKKCDERYPICQACETREITCHGYGLKPDWMDGGQQEKGVLKDIRHAIRDSRSQNRLKQRLGRKHATQLNTLQLDQSHQHLSSPPLLEPSQPDRDVVWGPIRASDNTYDSGCPSQCPSSLPTPRATHTAPNEKDSTQPTPDKLINYMTEEDREAALLMHYLDTVFPLQFAMYMSSPNVLGRGWLLALLMRTRPLKKIALALGACHLNAMSQKTNRPRCSEASRSSIEKYHTEALEELQLHITDLRQCRGDDDSKLNRSEEVLACILQLIYFELFRGSGETWKMHMQAASSVVTTLITDRETSKHLDVLSNTPLPPWSELKLIEASKFDYTPSTKEVSRDFFIGVFVYFDIIACASTRTGSLLPGSYNTLHGVTSSEIEISKIVGCENWVLIAIAGISELDMWQKEIGKNNEPSTLGPWLMARAAQIRVVLTNGLERVKEGEGPAKDGKFHPERTPHSGAISAITRVFASAALIYLHIVADSFSSSAVSTAESCSTAFPTSTAIPNFCPVSQPIVPSPSPLQHQLTLENLTTLSITALHSLCLVSPSLLRNVVWPFCVTGCMVSLPTQRKVFEELVRGAAPPSVDRNPGDLTSECTMNSLGRPLEVVREAWRLGDVCATERNKKREERWEKGDDRGDDRDGLDSVHVDWSRAMESLGRRSLLI